MSQLKKRKEFVRKMKEYLLQFFKYILVPIFLAITQYIISQIKSDMYQNIPDIIEILIAGFTAGYIGFLLVEVIDHIRKPKIDFIDFTVQEVNFGVLYNLNFKINGSKAPGNTAVLITWNDKSVYGKFPETPNPLIKDQLGDFEPSLVPSTYSHYLYSNRNYSIPVVIRSKGNIDIFSGWWFGKSFGYGVNPTVGKETSVKINIISNDFNWEKVFKVKEIINE